MATQKRSLPLLIALGAGGLTVTTCVLPTVATSPWDARLGGYLAAMTVFVVLMLWTMWPRAGERVSKATWPYFLVQMILLGLADFLMEGGGITWLASMPLLGQMSATRVDLHRLPGRIYWMLALFVEVSAFKVIAYGPVGYLYWVGPMAGCYIFVYGFSWMATEANIRREESERLAAELGGANAQLQAQAREIEELAQERERARVARELHDSLGHSLTTLAIQLEVAEALPDPASEKARLAVSRARILAQSALKDVREAVRSLRECADLRGLPERIQELVTTARTAGGQATFALKGAAVPLANDSEQALFRAAQEGLTNVHRHSRGAAVVVTLDYELPGTVSLRVENDGIGAQTPAPEGRGFGLKGLGERMTALGGRFSAGTRPQGGFLLCAEVPR